MPRYWLSPRSMGRATSSSTARAAPASLACRGCVPTMNHSIRRMPYTSFPHRRQNLEREQRRARSWHANPDIASPGEAYADVVSARWKLIAHRERQQHLAFLDRQYLRRFMSAGHPRGCVVHTEIDRHAVCNARDQHGNLQLLADGRFHALAG